MPSYHNVTVQLSGLKCPGFKREGSEPEVAEPFAEFLSGLNVDQRDVVGLSQSLDALKRK